MSRTDRSRPTGAAVVVSAMLGALALGGCGAGQITQTSSQVAAVGGANAGLGAVVVRDARIEFADDAEGGNVYTRGSDAPLTMSIVNSGATPDRLVSATSPAATSVRISGEAEVPGGQVLLVEGAPAAAPSSASATSGAAPSASVPSSGAPAPGAPAGGAPSLAPSDTVPGETSGGGENSADGQGANPQEAPAVPASSAPGAAPAAPSASTPSSSAGVVGAPREAQVVLTGLREDVRAGLTYPVVLTFERAGQISLVVPVGNPDEPRKDEPAE